MTCEAPKKFTALELYSAKAAQFPELVQRMIALLLSSYSRPILSNFVRPDYDGWRKFINAHVDMHMESALMLTIRPKGLSLTTSSDGTVAGKVHAITQTMPQGRRKFSRTTCHTLLSDLVHMYQQPGRKFYVASRSQRLQSALAFDTIFEAADIHRLDEIVSEVFSETRADINLVIFEGEIHLFTSAEGRDGYVIKIAKHNPLASPALTEI